MLSGVGKPCLTPPPAPPSLSSPLPRSVSYSSAFGTLVTSSSDCTINMWTVHSNLLPVNSSPARPLPCRLLRALATADAAFPAAVHSPPPPPGFWGCQTSLSEA